MREQNSVVKTPRADNHAVAQFDHCAQQYEDILAKGNRVRTQHYDAPSGVHRDLALPTASDFICDFELICKRALAGSPKLYAIFRSVYIERKRSEDAVQEVRPELLAELKGKCGKELLKLGPLFIYWTQTSEMRNAAQRQRAEVSTMLATEKRKKAA
jgi:hypothetical protein